MLKEGKKTLKTLRLATLLQNQPIDCQIVN